MSVPVESLSELVCRNCNKLLSYFPIYTKKNSADNSAICGRCTYLSVQNEDFMRNITYESLAQFLKFPCGYHSEGCVENLLPNEIPEHEKCCPYKVISCPCECGWRDVPTRVRNHIEESHPDILIDAQFEIDISQSYRKVNVVFHDDQIFRLNRTFEKERKILYFSASCLITMDSVTKYNYEVTLLNRRRNLSVTLPLRAFDDLVEVSVAEIDTDVMKEILQYPSVVIGYVQVFTEQNTLPLLESNSNIDLTLLRQLECPICLEYILPPIYQCITGHNICGDCKTRIAECPLCKKRIYNTQNFTLQNMALSTIYPCKNANCGFTSKPDEMKRHLVHCQFDPRYKLKCPLSDYEECSFESNFENLYSHVFNVHPHNILESDTLSESIHANYFNQEVNISYVKEFSKRFFKLHYRYAQNCFYWAVQLIGTPEEAKNYKFEIDILDNSNNKKKLFLRNFCAPLSRRKTFLRKKVILYFFTSGRLYHS